MAYYLTKNSVLGRKYIIGDQIEVKLIRNGKVIETEYFSEVILPEHYMTNESVLYIRWLINLLDDFLHLSPKGIGILQIASKRIQNDINILDDGNQIGFFNSFLYKLSDIICFFESGDDRLFGKRLRRILEGIGSVLSAFLIEYEANCLLGEKDSGNSKMNLDVLFDAHLNRQLLRSDGKMMVSKCLCTRVLGGNPYPSLSHPEESTFEILRPCDAVYSILGSVEKSHLKAVIRFGCVSDRTDRKVFLYYHYSNLGVVKPNSKVMNITLIFETNLSISFRPFAFGLTGFSLFKSVDKIDVDLRELVQKVPHLDLPILSGLYDVLKQYLGIYSDDKDKLRNLTIMLAEWLLENKVFNAGGDNVSYWLQPYFTSLTQKILFTKPSTNSARLHLFRIPEILCFTEWYYEHIQKCINGLIKKLKSGEPLIAILVNKEIIAACGHKVSRNELFYHPCFVVNLMLGVDRSVFFYPPNDQNILTYKFEPWIKGVNDQVSKFNGCVCRLCKRIYPNLQFSLLCGIRCHVLYLHFTSATNFPELVTGNEVSVSPPNDVKLTILTGTLVTELPYIKERLVGKRSVIKHVFSP